MPVSHVSTISRAILKLGSLHATVTFSTTHSHPFDQQNTFKDLYFSSSTLDKLCHRAHYHFPVRGTHANSAATQQDVFVTSCAQTSSMAAIICVRSAAYFRQKRRKCRTDSRSPQSQFSSTPPSHRDWERFRAQCPSRSRAKITCCDFRPTKKAGAFEISARILDRCCMPPLFANVLSHISCLRCFTAALSSALEVARGTRGCPGVGDVDRTAAAAFFAAVSASSFPRTPTCAGTQSNSTEIVRFSEYSLFRIVRSNSNDPFVVSRCLMRSSALWESEKMKRRLKFLRSGMLAARSSAYLIAHSSAVRIEPIPIEYPSDVGSPPKMNATPRPILPGLGDAEPSV